MIQRILFFCLTVFGIYFGSYVYVLRTHFPNIDFSKFRFGIASWYSQTDKNINEYTASGESFNDQDRTCASWDYPFQEKLLVINAVNLKWTVCRVNDRGPGKRLHRAIDLSKATFKRIANLRRGLIYVVIIPTNGKAAKS
ncbi:MAG TPA: septal ring lytic transglycosylase RlpA family protein [Candidatus Omnitrophota bacterium]|nr:septal ring lytic transglycosylase RlpA family protein [Candidatus Omnitrophota bacterium]